MADWTPEEIMDKARAAYGQVDSVGYDVKAIKKMIKDLVSAIYYLAKMQLPPETKKKSMALRPKKAMKR